MTRSEYTSLVPGDIVESELGSLWVVLDWISAGLSTEHLICRLECIIVGQFDGGLREVSRGHLFIDSYTVSRMKKI
jgi:hypothetical protein